MDAAAVALSGSPGMHVYSVTQSGTVYRYPIVDGSVSTTPDLTLNVLSCDRCVEANGLAVDADGDLYVVLTGQGPGYGSIEEFAPGASENATPVRTLAPIPGGATSVAVDSQGYVYAIGDQLYVYPPGYTTATIKSSAPASAYGLAVDPNGDVIVASQGLLTYYSNPHTSLQLDYETCVGTGPSGGPLMYGLAVGDMDGRSWIFASQAIKRATNPEPLGRIGIWQGSASRSCPQPTAQHVVSLGAPYSQHPRGVALDTTDGLLVVGVMNQEAFVYKALTYGKQKPIATLHGDWGVAVGP